MGKSKLNSLAVASKGDFNAALNLAMSVGEDSSSSSAPAATSSAPAPSSSLFAHFPKESGAFSADLPNTEALLQELKEKFGSLLNTIKGAVGEDYNEQGILLCLEKYNGDAKQVVTELLGQSTQSLERSIRSSRDGIRRSATLVASNLKVSTGIEELPVNLDLSILGSTSENDEDEDLFANLPPMYKASDLTNGQPTTVSAPATMPPAKHGAPAPTTAQNAPKKVSINMGILEEVLSDAYAEIKHSTAPDLAPWPTAPVVVTQPEAPRAPAQVRILDKSELSKESKVDQDTLKEFLSQVGTRSSSAAESARKISTDDFGMCVFRLHRRLLP